MSEWAVYDPYDGWTENIATEEAAIGEALSRIEGYLDDGSWDEDVEGILVAKVIHRPVRKVLGVRAEMDPDAWDELTGGSESDEWWDYTIGGQERL